MHLIRHSLKYVPRREREQVARDLKPIYTAIDADAAHQALERFDQQWGKRFPVITQAWLDAWEHATPFLARPEVRRVIYTTDENVKSVDGSGPGFRGWDRSRGVLGGPQGAFMRLGSERIRSIGAIRGMRGYRRRRGAVAGEDQRRLGCRVGVVDPRAKRRIRG